jgi:indole-3-glycerol phosphate synthase
VQVKPSWHPPDGALGRLSERARARAATLDLAELRAAAEDSPPVPSMSSSLTAGSTLRVIAEIKRRSPSKGVIDDQIDAGTRAAAYAEGGAAAISVLTESVEFGGRLEDIAAVRASCTLPVLKKDFHVAPAHVWEARAIGASALLLIARALNPERLLALVDVSREVGIEVLVEVRREAELALAVESGAIMIGVNSRDLETLVIDPAVIDFLLPQIPADRVAIAESGIQTTADAERAARAGADAVLVGSSLSVAVDPRMAVRSLGSIARRARSR